MVKKFKDEVGTPQDQFEAILADEDEVEVQAEKSTRNRERPRRRKVYERVSETEIPDDVKESFLKDDYELRWVRWAIGGDEDYRYLARREKEGYEFVTQDELPKSFLAGLRLQDTRVRKGLVTSGDLCLMKVDSDLRKSRIDYYSKATDAEVKAADVYTLVKNGKGAFRDLGSKSSTDVAKEPRFQ